MTRRSLQDSKAEGGPHHRLAQLVGEWEGTTRTWLEPGQGPDESPWRGTMRLALDGRFVVHEYEGSIQGKPLSGVAMYGYHLDRDRWEMAWIDSFHNGTAVMFSTGGSGEGEGEGDGEGGFKVLGSFEAPPGPRWGWRTEIAAPEADRVVITHYVITPEGREAKGMETEYRRRG